MKILFPYAIPIALAAACDSGLLSLYLCALLGGVRVWLLHYPDYEVEDSIQHHSLPSLLQANQAYFPQSLLIHQMLQTPHHLGGFHRTCSRYQLDLKSLLPATSSPMVPVVFHLPCNPSVPSTCPPFGCKDIVGHNCSLIKVSLSINLFLAFL